MKRFLLNFTKAGMTGGKFSLENSFCKFPTLVNYDKFNYYDNNTKETVENYKIHLTLQPCRTSLNYLNTSNFIENHTSL